MAKENLAKEEQWLEKLASEYDGSLPYQNETEVILWLQKRAAETEDGLERKKYRELIDEAENFGGSDDWGALDPELIGFARLLMILQSRTKKD